MLETALLFALVVSQTELASEPKVEDYTLANGRIIDIGSGATRVTALAQFPTPAYGFFPLPIHIDNTTGPKQTLKISFLSNSGNGSHTFSRNVDIEAHERRTVVLPVPTLSRYGSLRVHGPGITKGGDQSLYMSSVSAKQRAVLNLGTPDSFMEAVGARPSYTSNADTQVVSLGLDEAPSDVTAYLGWDSVILTGGTFDALSEGQRHAVEAYAALGGQLILMQSARGLASSFPLLEGDTSGYGIGSVRFCDHCGYPAELAHDIRVPLRAIEQRGKRSRYSYAYDGDANEAITELSLPVAKAPVGRFLLIIALFTLAIGPGSLWIARKRGPSLLLLTIPGTAALTCMLIVGYSIVRDGFSVHATVQGFTLLDSRSHRAITASVGAFYANLAPPNAQFPLDAAVLSPAAARDYGGVEQAASMTFEQGTRLGSDFIPSRSYREWTFLSAQPTRARLVVKPGPEGALLVQNALGAEIEVAHIVQDGKTYAVTSLKDGQEKTASVVKNPEPVALSSLDKRMSQGLKLAMSSALRSGEFKAMLIGPGFTQLGGLKLTDHESRHLVRGSVER